MPDFRLIDLYLKELREALRFPPPLQERILMEVDDHLSEGTKREQSRGLSPESAQQRAIARFGTPERLAAWLATEYAAEIITGPLPDEGPAVEGTAHGGTTVWQKFTERARRLIYFAQEEAARCGTIYVGTEHLLLGLVRDHDSLAGDILRVMRISHGEIMGKLLSRLTRESGEEPGGEMQLTPCAKQAIDLAWEEAQSLGHDYIGTEHLFLGLIREEEGLAGKTLREMGADLERTRQAIPLAGAQRSRGTHDPVAAAWRLVEDARRRLTEAEAIHAALLKASAMGVFAESATPVPTATSSPGATASPSVTPSDPSKGETAPEPSA